MPTRWTSGTNTTVNIQTWTDAINNMTTPMGSFTTRMNDLARAADDAYGLDVARHGHPDRSEEVIEAINSGIEHRCEYEMNSRPVRCAHRATKFIFKNPICKHDYEYFICESCWERRNRRGSVSCMRGQCAWIETDGMKNVREVVDLP